MFCRCTAEAMPPTRTDIPTAAATKRVLPEAETRRATRSAARDPHDDPKPPLRISSKDVGAASNGKAAPAKPGAAASKTASDDSKADKAKKVAAASDGEDARDGKRSRLPTVGRLRRREE